MDLSVKHGTRLMHLDAVCDHMKYFILFISYGTNDISCSDIQAKYQFVRRYHI